MNQSNHISHYEANKIDEFLGIIFFCSLCLTVYFYNALEAIFVVLAVISAIRYRNLLSFLRSNDAVSLFFWVIILYSAFFLFRGLWGEYSNLSYNISFLVNNVIAFYVAVLVARFPMEGVQKSNIGYILIIFIFLFGAFWFFSYYLFALDSIFMLPHGRLQFFQGKSPFGPAFIFWGLILWYLSRQAVGGALRLRHLLILVFVGIVFIGLFVNSRGVMLGLIFSLVYLALKFEGSWKNSILLISVGALLFNVLSSYLIFNSGLDKERSFMIFSSLAEQKIAFFIYIGVAILFYLLSALIGRILVLQAVVLGLTFFMVFCLFSPDTVLQYIKPFRDLNPRFQLWESAISHFSNMPFFGYGRNFEVEVITLKFPYVQNQEVIILEFPFVHNQYLSWVLEGGVFGLACGLLFLFGTFLRFFSGINRLIIPFYGAFLIMWSVIIFFDGFMSMRGYLNIFIIQSVLFLSTLASDELKLNKNSKSL